MEFYHFLQIKTQILFFFFQFQEIIFCYYFNYYLFYCFTLLLTLCVIGFICDIYFGSLLYVYFLSAVCLQFAETWQDPSRKNNNNVRRPHHPNNSLRSLKKSSKKRTLMTSYLLSVQVINQEKTCLKKLGPVHGIVESKHLILVTTYLVRWLRGQLMSAQLVFVCPHLQGKQ